MNITKYLWLAVFVLIFGFSATLSSAADKGQDPVELGKKYFAEKDYEKALEQFQIAFNKNPADIGINYHIGRTTFELGDYEAAAMAYDRILAIKPDMVRVKLELARTYYRLGVKEMAKANFKEVLATNPPEKVRRNIEAFLAKIDAADKRHFFDGSVTFGVSRDTNPKVAPESARVNTVFGDVILNDKSLAQQNYTYSNTTVLNYKYKFKDEPYVLKATAINYNSFFDTLKDQDVNFYGLMVGPGLELDRFIVDTRFLVNRLDKDYHLYMKSYGLSASFMMVLSRSLIISGNMKFENKEFHDAKNPDTKADMKMSQKDASNKNLSIGPMFMWGANRATVRIGAEFEDASEEANSYDRKYLNLRYDRQFRHGYSAYAGYKYQATEYHAVSTSYRTWRYDKIHYFTLGGSKKLAKNVTAEISHTHTKSLSNIDLYDYHRDQTNFQLTWTF